MAGKIAVTELDRYVIWKGIEAKYRLPAVYLEALSKGESNWKSDARTGSFVGLLQVGPMVLDGYNKANKTSIRPQDLLNARINAEVAAWQIRVIANMYNESKIPALQEDWTSLEWVAMLTAGWNSGYSKKAGTLKVARWMHEHGETPTHEKLFSRSGIAGGTKHLRNATKRRWQRGVALRTFRVREGQPLGA